MEPSELQAFIKAISELDKRELIRLKEYSKRKVKAAESKISDRPIWDGMVRFLDGQIVRY